MDLMEAMSLDAGPSNGFVASGPSASAAAAAEQLADGSLPIFDVERVQLQFSIAADFVAAQVANNVIVLALSNGRILRIDLNKPEDIDDIDLPKKPSDTGVICRMFLDPTASHLVICTSMGDNYYLHSQSHHPRALHKLRGVPIECIAWNPSLPTASTREILFGAADGNIYETYIESNKDRFLQTLKRVTEAPVTGLWVDDMAEKDRRRVMIGTRDCLYHMAGKVGSGSYEGSRSIYAPLFDAEVPVTEEFSLTSTSSVSELVVSPDSPDSDSYENEKGDRAFAWLSAQGVFHGTLVTGPVTPDLGRRVMSASTLLPKTQLVSTTSPAKRRVAPDTIDAIALTQWHIVLLVGGRVVAINRLSGNKVYDQAILDNNQKAIGLTVDQQKNTFWLFTSGEIFEVVVRDEDRDIWKILLDKQQFGSAMKHAHTNIQKDAVSISYGDFLVTKAQFLEAATVWGKSSKPFEEVSLTFIDNAQQDALRKYLLAKLQTFSKSSIMQRMMIATWLVEVFMTKLNSLEDTLVTKAELSADLSQGQTQEQLAIVQSEFQDFINRYKNDLDQKTVYDVVGSHGREEELLYFANSVNDYNYVLSYWVQRQRWQEALQVLKKQTNPDIFYKYSSVLMAHCPRDLVEILMRHPNLKPRRLIPALLEYEHNYKGPLEHNQAVRYLQYVVSKLASTDSAVHNTLVSMYASQPSPDETALQAYLETQQQSEDRPRFDPDFALRLCIQHKRVLSCVHIYTSMGQYPQAVDLALAHGQIDLAALTADRPRENPKLRKKLWLAVARKVISQSSEGIKTAIDFLKRCELLRIEDLIPFFPDFVVIDDFKEEICAALEDYGRSIDNLKREMDESAKTATNIKIDIAALDHRYAIVEPGEKCYVCGLPLLSKQFFVFPCQHAFHSDCLGRKVLEQAGMARSQLISELQVKISKGLVTGRRKEEMVQELDALVASACVLCSDYAIKRIDEPFVTDADNLEKWAL
ncbi:hypothetical protein MKZ38_000422 [Zalerion maritima]|uniref:Pep3/Vps18/deep orange domain-containing protein n=1 Tax=Zalerion maritima TaxID=339359 RepID=A0AAD5RZG8_9PEZI|nr:hypothetical protein MKZ38_000422 [Zalerion maritima]